MSKKRSTTKKQRAQKKASSIHRIGWLLGGILLFIAAGAASYVALSTFLPRDNHTPAKQQAQQSVDTSAPTALTPSAVIDAIEAAYETRYTLLDIDENNQPGDGELSVGLSKDAPLYQSEGYDFFSDYDNGAAITILTYTPPSDTAVPSQVTTKIRTEIAELLTTQGLKKDSQASRVHLEPGTPHDVYTAAGIVCVTQAPTAETAETSVQCGATDDYTTAAADYQPFVTLLTEASPPTTDKPLVSHLAVRNSLTEGYQLASIAYEGAAAHFYKQTDGEWTFFTLSQSILNCTDYDTAELRAAYRSEPCIGPDQQTTQLY